MDNNRPLDNMEEKRDLNSPDQKQTKENNLEPGGLNDGNPNVNRTPANNPIIREKTGDKPQLGSIQ